jgi:hypothetical protein
MAAMAASAIDEGPQLDTRFQGHLAMSSIPGNAIGSRRIGASFAPRTRYVLCRTYTTSNELRDNGNELAVCGLEEEFSCVVALLLDARGDERQQHVRVDDNALHALCACGLPR